jgi:hypothetical protein
VTQAGKHLTLSDDADGTINCRIVLRLTNVDATPIAKTSADVPLGVIVTPESREVEQIEIVTSSPVRRDREIFLA